MSSSQDRLGRAGRRGDDVRSDLWVEFSASAGGGIEIELESKVEAYYGAALREQALAVLTALGVEHGKLSIDDQGALPFVVAARIEAAVRRSGVRTRGDSRPPRTIAQPAPSPRDRLRRSRLYLPGNEPKYFVNAGLYGPDAVILDLEDSVHADDKEATRLLVRNALCAVDFRGAERMVRINQLPLGLADLEAIAPEEPDLLVIPKVEEPDQVREVDEALTRINGAGGRPLWLMPILETARGIENSFAVASATRRVVALTLGLEDYAADLGVQRSAEGIESVYARRRVVNAAKAAGVQAIDSVYGQVDDLEGLEAWAAGSRQLGYEGMGCLHPRQIDVIHRAFDPTEAEVERALHVVRAFDEARARGLGVVSLGSKMIDPPVVAQAQRLVLRARALGLIED